MNKSIDASTDLSTELSIELSMVLSIESGTNVSLLSSAEPPLSTNACICDLVYPETIRAQIKREQSVKTRRSLRP